MQKGIIDDITLINNIIHNILTTIYSSTGYRLSYLVSSTNYRLYHSYLKGHKKYLVTSILLHVFYIPIAL